MSKRKRKAAGKSEFAEEECAVKLRDGHELRFPSHPDDCAYVRITDEDGEEEVYWHYDEFAMDAKDTLGALMGAIMKHSKKDEEDEDE